jgi:hypothetical protein
MLVITLCSYELYSETQNVDQSLSGDESLQHSNSRISMYAGIGVLELSAIGIQKQIADHQFVGIKLSTYLLSGKGGIPEGTGAGVTWTIFTSNDKFINVFNAELTYIFKNDHIDNPPYAIGAEINAGHKNYEEGFHLFWLVGISASLAPKIYDIYSPMVKIGANYNF